MCISIFFAQVLGAYLFITGLAMLVHSARFKKNTLEAMNNEVMVNYTSGMNLLFGLIIAVSHNIWVSEWPVVITILGWILIIQGIMRLYFPAFTERKMKSVMADTGYTVVCWIWLLVGVYLIWAGYSN